MLEKSIARLYGDLSNAAHVATHEIVRAATDIDLSKTMKPPEPTSETRYYPIFDIGLSRRFFTLHLMLILNVIEELSLQLNKRNQEDNFIEKKEMQLACASIDGS